MKTLLWISLLLLLLLPVQALADDEADPTVHRLFHIERNKNANIVVYDALSQPDGNLIKKDPVIVYWLKLAEDGERKGLKGIEKRMAYGFKIEEREGNVLELKMKADVGRNLWVKPVDDTYKAFMEIDGHQAVVEKIFIFATEGGLIPTVEYIELFGEDVETGEDRYEKFLP